MTFTFTVKANFRVASKQIDLDARKCSLRDGTRVPCVDFEVNMQYNGVEVPDSLSE